MDFSHCRVGNARLKYVMAHRGESVARGGVLPQWRVHVPLGHIPCVRPICCRFCRKLSVAMVYVNCRLSPDDRYLAQYDDGLDILYFLESRLGWEPPLGLLPGGRTLQLLRRW